MGRGAISRPGGACAASSFVLQAGSASGLSNLANFNTGSAATTYTATSVPNGTYYVRVLGANSSGTSAASNEVTVSVGGTPGASLSGVWQGTITPRLSSPVQVDFTHVGTSLTGAVRGRAAGQAISFQLSQSADPAIFSGNLVFEGTGGSACGAGAQAGSLQVSSGSTTMTGTFTRAAEGTCPSQTNQVQLTKQ